MLGVVYYRQKPGFCLVGDIALHRLRANHSYHLAEYPDRYDNEEHNLLNLPNLYDLIAGSENRTA